MATQSDSGEQNTKNKCTHTTSITNHTYTGTKRLKGDKTFDCGLDIINRFVRNNLRDKGKADTAAVTVLLDSENDNKLVGFFTISAHSINRDDFSSADLLGRTPKVVSAVKLEMLGVDKAYKGLGLGRELISLAIQKTVHISQSIGCHGMFLTADKDAVAFYENLGFVALDEPCEQYGNTPMFLSLQNMLEAITD